MNEINQLRNKSDRTFILVCLNFIMLFVLFCGLGYVVWQSATLIDMLRDDLGKAEKTVAELRIRIGEMDMDRLMDRVAGSAVDKLKESVSSAVEDADFMGRLEELSAKIDSAHDGLERTADSVRAIDDKLQQLDAERLGQVASYQILKGLGEGFNQAAEARLPSKGN